MCDQGRVRDNDGRRDARACVCVSVCVCVSGAGDEFFYIAEFLRPPNTTTHTRTLVFKALVSSLAQ